MWHNKSHATRCRVFLPLPIHFTIPPAAHSVSPGAPGNIAAPLRALSGRGPVVQALLSAIHGGNQSPAILASLSPILTAGNTIRGSFRRQHSTVSVPATVFPLIPRAITGALCLQPGKAWPGQINSFKTAAEKNIER
jgi:hypothetical protein